MSQVKTSNLSTLENWGENYRHGDIQAIQNSIRTFGFNSPIGVSDGVVYVGNQRLAALKAMFEADPSKPPIGIKKKDNDWIVPVVDLSHLSADKLKAYAIADNRTHDLGTDNETQLVKLLQELSGDFEIEAAIGYSQSDYQELLDSLADATDSGAGMGGATDNEPDTRQGPSSVGDIWICGRHRVLCGDSTNAEDVKRLLNGNVIDMVLTDPPYGVSYVGKTEDALTIENDDLDDQGLLLLLQSSLGHAFENCRGGAYWYVAAPPGPPLLPFLQVLIALDVLRQCLAWVKDRFVMGHSEYHYAHEMILFGWKDGHRHKNKDRARSSVWNVAKPHANNEHPTMKPVELWEMAVRDGSRDGELIYDPFLGSGTTLVVSEAMGRKCAAVELCPRYCDASVRRWQEMTGQKAVRESDGALFADLDKSFAASR